MLAFGSKLPNGATVIQAAQRADGTIFVLAHWDRGGRDSLGEYITWRLDTRNQAAFGRYFVATPLGLHRASADLAERADIDKTIRD